MRFLPNHISAEPPNLNHIRALKIHRLLDQGLLKIQRLLDQGLDHRNCALGPIVILDLESFPSLEHRQNARPLGLVRLKAAFKHVAVREKKRPFAAHGPVSDLSMISRATRAPVHAAKDVRCDRCDTFERKALVLAIPLVPRQCAANPCHSLETSAPPSASPSASSSWGDSLVVRAHTVCGHTRARRPRRGRRV